MTEGIAKAIEIEHSKSKQLYFIDIVADDIDYMAQLSILNKETDAPILIATSNYSDDEREEALNNGADFYGKYCENPEKNIRAVESVLKSIGRRATKKTSPPQVIIYKDLLLSFKPNCYVFVGDKRTHLTTAREKAFTFVEKSEKKEI